MHFEIPADNIERAKNFYEKVFNWHINSIPQMNYSIIHTSQVDSKNMITKPGRINGGMMQRSQDIRHPIITIVVKNVDESLKHLVSHGGQIVGEKMTVGDMGIAAYFKDTEGNILGLWQPLKDDGY